MKNNLYRYNKLFAIITRLLIGITIILLAVFFPIRGTTSYKIMIIAADLLLVSADFIICIRKCVITEKTFASFNSFNILRKGKPSQDNSQGSVRYDTSSVIRTMENAKGIANSAHFFNVKYSDIYGVEGNFLPIIGLYSVKLTIKDLKSPLRIGLGFENRFNLYFELCENVKRENPKAYISKRLVSFLEEKLKREML